MRKALGVFLVTLFAGQGAFADQMYVRCQRHGGDLTAGATDQMVWIRNFFDAKPFYEGVMDIGSDRAHKASKTVKVGKWWSSPKLKLWYVGPEWEKVGEVEAVQGQARVDEITDGDVKQVIHEQTIRHIDVETFKRLPQDIIFEMKHGLIHHKIVIPALSTHTRVHFGGLPDFQSVGFAHAGEGVLSAGGAFQVSAGYDCVLHALPGYAASAFAESAALAESAAMPVE